MILVDITDSLTTKLSNEYNNVKSISLNNKPFAEGGFGKVYECELINQKAPSVPLIIKIFIDNKAGSLAHNYNTSVKLQQELSKVNDDLKNNTGQNLISHYPALVGFIQFSFEGNVRGKNVKGIACYNLKKKNYIDFEHLLGDDTHRQKYMNLSLTQRERIAYSIVSCFQLFESISYIHADLKPGALFVNLKEAKIALIDFDSGVVTTNVNDEPSTWGAANDWVAPEIWEQQIKMKKSTKITVDKYTDRWSVFICISHLLTLFNPLFILKKVSRLQVSRYVSSGHQWPDIDKTADYYNSENEIYLNWYHGLIRKEFSQSRKELFIQTIEEGYGKPSTRPSYKVWMKELEPYKAKPDILYFREDISCLQKNGAITLSWKVEKSMKVYLDGRQVDSESTTTIYVQKDYVGILKATNIKGEVSEKVRVIVPKEAPSIKYFNTSSNMVDHNNRDVFLSWKVSNAERIEIDNGVGNVTQLSEVKVSPKRDMTYTLKAYSRFGSIASKTVSIAIFDEKPIITQFGSNVKYILKPRYVGIHWKVEKADKCFVSYLGNVKLSGTKNVFVDSDINYTITATSYFGSTAQSTFTITAKDTVPVIKTFKISPNSVVLGSKAILIWDVRSASSVSISGIGKVKMNGHKYIDETNSTYELVAESNFGKQVILSITPKVISKPMINKVSTPSISPPELKMMSTSFISSPELKKVNR